MCGRFAAGHLTQAQMLAIMEHFLYGSPLPDDLSPPPAEGYNIKPTQQVRMIFDQGKAPVCSTARWWFVPHWFKGEVTDWKATSFNAKIETAHEKPTFRTAWRTGRCLIPALGYYEWTGPKGNKQPWYVTVEQNAPVLFFAGLQSLTNSGLRTCTILTRAALPVVADLHARMPVILPPEQAVHWLQKAETDQEIIDGYGADWRERLITHPVRQFGLDDDGEELSEACF
jgi:putative SOS response-associated peptidase YedK